MKLLGIALAALIALIQYPLWLGKGGWLRASEIDRQLAAQKAKNADLARRNDALAAEVRDLKSGTDAIEERARHELGLVRPDEIFYQYDSRGPQASEPRPEHGPQGTQGQ